MKKSYLYEFIPKDKWNMFSANIFFIKRNKIIKRINREMVYSKSEFYNTDKMRCYVFHKPVIL